jgi:hypothetical protein
VADLRQQHGFPNQVTMALAHREITGKQMEAFRSRKCIFQVMMTF